MSNLADASHRLSADTDGMTNVCYQKGNTMKKITVRKAGTVRLTSAAASCYCQGTGPIVRA
jgi:hypothetical protein